MKSTDVIIIFTTLIKPLWRVGPALIGQVGKRILCNFNTSTVHYLSFVNQPTKALIIHTFIIIGLSWVDPQIKRTLCSQAIGNEHAKPRVGRTPVSSSVIPNIGLFHAER